MSNSITVLREELRTDLQALGWKVYLTPPKSGAAPALVMRTPATRYLVPGSTFGREWRLRVDLVLLVPNQEHEAATATLDELIVQLLEDVPEQWDVEQDQGVGGLFLVQLGGTTYPAQTVAVSALVTPTRTTPEDTPDPVED